MRIKTSELNGPALDWAVAKCEGHEWRNAEICPQYSPAGTRSWCHWRPSTDWSQGGPITERENISIDRPVKQRGCAVIGFHDWHAMHPKNYGGLIRFSGSGSSPLIAAMRCYVASKLGDEVDVPDEVSRASQTKEPACQTPGS